MSIELRKYYNGKRVFITGDTGFKGSWLALWLNELGAEVIGYANGFPSDPCNFSLCELGSRITHIEGDVRDYDSLEKHLKNYKPEIVFHLAAQALVRYSYEEPKSTIETNVMGTINIMEAVRRVDGVRSLVIVTSDKCYDNKEHVWGYRENDPMGGDDPYSSSKGAAELVFRSYLKSFFSKNGSIGAATVRAGNVIGGGDWARDRIVSDTVRSLSRHEKVKVRNPNAIRPWQHVLEPLSGYLVLGMRAALEPHRFSGAWNFGPVDTSARRVADLVDAIVREWGSGEWEDISGVNNPDTPEANWLRLACDKAHVLLPWSAVLTFEENIQMTVHWYMYHYEYPDANMYQYCAHQIRKYTKIASKRQQLWAGVQK